MTKLKMEGKYLARDQDQVDLRTNVTQQENVAALAVFPVGVVTCERGIFQVSQEQEQQ